MIVFPVLLAETSVPLPKMGSYNQSHWKISHAFETACKERFEQEDDLGTQNYRSVSSVQHGACAVLTTVANFAYLCIFYSTQKVISNLDTIN